MKKYMKLLGITLGLGMTASAAAINCGETKCSTEIKQLHTQAINGSATAQRALGYMYRDGTVLKKNARKSFQWFEQASRFDDASASTLHELGVHYLYGKGIKAREYKGIELLQRAALKEFVPSQILLGSEYLLGETVKVDFSLARYWFTEAAKAGDLQAIYISSVLNAKGIGGERSLEDANKLMQLAAEWDYANAKLIIEKSGGSLEELLSSLELMDEYSMSRTAVKDVINTPNLYLAEKLFLNDKMIAFVESNQKELDRLERSNDMVNRLPMNSGMLGHSDRIEVSERHGYPVTKFGTRRSN